MIQITRISLLNLVNSTPFQFTILEIPKVMVRLTGIYIGNKFLTLKSFPFYFN